MKYTSIIAPNVYAYNQLINIIKFDNPHYIIHEDSLRGIPFGSLLVILNKSQFGRLDWLYKHIAVKDLQVMEITYE